MINNQYQQQPYYGNVPYNQGVMYNNQQPVKRTNPLTSAEINSLKTKTPFSLAVTQDEVLRGICFHVDENGNPVTVTNGDGSTSCPICGKKWNSNELSADEVQAAADNILSVLQTIKLMYLNFPEQAAREFYQIIPLIEKVPQLYKIAADNFRTYEGYTNGYYNGQPNPFMLFGQIAGGNGFGNAFQYQQTQPMYNQPMMNQPMYGAQPQPVAYNQPAMNPPMYGAAPANPFDAASYNAQPAGAYAPATPTGYAYAPGQAAAPVTQGQPVASAAAPAQPAAQTAPAASTAPAEVTSNGNHTP